MPPNLREIVRDVCMVKPGRRVKLADYDPAWAGDRDVPKEDRKRFAEDELARSVAEVAEAQELLYAADTWSVLAIFQAMDAAGKDSTIKHVMTGVNPQGCQVTSFKQPSAEELDHTYLWRCTKALPERGRIGIFNRSYYEEVLVVKVHPQLTHAQRIPGADPSSKRFWEDRYDDINAFERHLVRNGTLVLKFFLNVSREEQRRRFFDRLDEPGKLWKFSAGDVAERALWDRYMEAYEDAISATSTEHAPWFIVPADHKWVTRAIVAHLLADAIQRLDLKYPTVSDTDMAAINDARRKLEAEGPIDRDKNNGKKKDRKKDD